MPIRSTPIIPSTASKVHVHITQYKNGDIHGWLYNDYSGETVHFISMVDMANKMEQLFDLLSYPQATVSFRSFSSGKTKDTIYKGSSSPVKELSLENQPVLKEFSSFVIHVTARHNATWQGTLLTPLYAGAQPFQSMLELMKMIDNHLIQQESEGDSIHSLGKLSHN